MAFAVPCKSCGARFLLNDDLLRRKIAGSVVTVRCRHCEAKIQIDASEMDPTTLPSNDKPEPLRNAELASDDRSASARTEPRPQAVVALSPGLLTTRALPELDAELVSEVPPSEPELFDLGDWDVEEFARSAPGRAPRATELRDGRLPDTAPSHEIEAVSSAAQASHASASEAPPSSSDVPSLHALAHLEPERAPTLDPLLLSLGAERGGPDSSLTPPSIDVSSLRNEAPRLGPTIDVSHLGNDPERHAPRAAALPLYDVEFEPEAPPPSAGRLSTLSPASLDSDGEDGRDAEPRSAGARHPVVKKRSLGLPFALGAASALAFAFWWSGGNSKPRAAAASPPIEPAVAPVEAAPAAPVEAAPAPAVAGNIAGSELRPAPEAAVSEAPAKPAVAPTPAKARPSAATKNVRAAAKPEPETSLARDEPAPAADEPVRTEVEADFDRGVAQSALASAASSASACRAEGDPSGVASVTVTFAPSGKVTNANLSGPPFAGTKTGSCIASALRKATVPAFAGDRVTVSKTIVVQ